ncbi:MAG TPA: class D sortase [Thermoanaerobaculia bacterium]|nr:class D sortase [Thermoanaerobaculia bacterium]
MPLPKFLIKSRWLERLLFLIGIVCLGIWVYAFVDARIYKLREERRLDEAIRLRTAAAPSSSTVAPAADTDALGSFRKEGSREESAREKKLAEGDLIGRIEIPRIGVSAIVLHGIGNKTLRHGVGHIPGTPLPERGGNVGLAAHRDSFFRGLKDIRKDDIIELTTLDGSFKYQVEWTKIVPPEETAVLADEGSPALTLVTCYPFYYVGSAPKRFIVRAHRFDDSDDDRMAG